MRNVPNIHGPGMVRGDALSKTLVDFLLDMWERVHGAQDTADSAAQAASSATAPSISITGDGVSGSAESGYVITAPASNAGAPLLVADDAIYTVSANTQVLYSLPITVDGRLVIDGYLVQV